MKAHDTSHLVGCDNCVSPRCKGEFGLGPLFFRPIHLNHRGDEVPLHDHPRPHVSIVMRGRVAATLVSPGGDTETREYVAGSPVTCLIHIPAGVRHRFVALEDDTIMACVFAHYDRYGQPSESVVPGAERWYA